ncbi:MAG: methyltransferase domain-containing protein [Bacteroidetes bacterium]|nr:methyltransferase domain-containing protein [Bacteroidota bacterium]
MGAISYIKARTSNFRNAIWHSNKFGYRVLRPLYASAHFTFSFLFNSAYRNKTIDYLKYRKHYHQFPNFTKANRYPDLFSICQRYFKDKEQVRILSFGCSTGEEVYSINEYLPEATIVGTDISEYNLKECNKKEKKKNISFIHSLSETYQQSKNFDAIFCLAVLQHNDNFNKDIPTATKYTFSQFEEQIITLDEKLKSGGLFFIDQTDFNFLETKLRNQYFPLEVRGNRKSNPRPLYNSKNIRISNEHNCFRVFLKK